jgi:hypothetical protein
VQSNNHTCILFTWVHYTNTANILKHASSNIGTVRPGFLRRWWRWWSVVEVVEVVEWGGGVRRNEDE